MASKGCVLVVDDDQKMRRLGELWGEVGAFEVITAGSGEEALARFEESSDRVVCVLLDATMRGGMNGMETGARLRAFRADLPLIFMSGYNRSTFTEMEEDARTRFLRKPFGLRDLLDAIRAMIPDA